MTRPRCSVFIATSLDGFIARRDGSIDWLDVVQRPGEDHGFQAFFDSVDTLVMGRRTYETALTFEEWPYTGKRCVVLTHAALTTRHGEQFLAGEPRALLDQLGQEGARHIYIDGGVVVSAFLRAQLIDALTVSVVPVLLGAGVPLFAGGAPEQTLILASSRAFDSGLVQLRYQVVRPASGDV